MFTIELIYKADLKQIDAHMGGQMRFLRKYYKAGPNEATDPAGRALAGPRLAAYARRS